LKRQQNTLLCEKIIRNDTEEDDDDNSEEREFQQEDFLYDEAAFIPTGDKKYIPIDNIESVFTFGSTRFNTRFLYFLSQHHIPVNNFSLLQNYPNPFNPTTRIQYSVAGYQFVNLSVYDVLGRNIATLVNEQKQPGNYFVDFNANNLASGIYFYSLRVNNSTKTRKMIIIK